jgi:putative CocE/NonD family hydrolase
VGGFKVGSGAVLDMEKLHKEWYDSVLKGKPRPEFLKDRVMVYVTGENAWHSAPSFEALAPDTVTLYLGGAAGGHDLFRSGALTATAPAEKSEARLVLDPAKMQDRDAFDESARDTNWLTTQRGAYGVSDREVFFHSEPFQEDVELTGIPELRLWVSSSVPDADLTADLYEVRPDGSAVYLSYGILRLRYRDDIRKPSALPIDTPVLVDLKNLSLFAHKVSKNSRLRLRVGLVDSPAWQRNPETAGRVATLRVLSDPEHPSVLRLPRGRKGA